MRPTQGRTLAVMQVSGGSQWFNAINTLRPLGRWLGIVCIPNRSSVAKAFGEIDQAGRMRPSPFHDPIIGLVKGLVRFAVLLRPHTAALTDRASERRATGGPAIDVSADLSAIATTRQARGGRL